MSRSKKSVFLAAAILAVACLAAGCSSATSAISSLTSRTATAPPASPRPSASDTPTPTVSVSPSVSVSVSPSVSVSVSPTVSVSVSSSVTTVTASPSTPTPTPSVTATPTATSSTSLLWLWILLGAAVLAGLITWIVVASRRRSAAGAGWRSRLIDAYAKGSALHDAMSVAETPGAMTAADANARWYDIQRRADDLAQTLYALREAAPDDADRARIADTLASMQAARSAMDAERAPGGAGPQQAEVVRGRLAAFESSLRTLRASEQGSP
jgi:hypothetical protein